MLPRPIAALEGERLRRVSGVIFDVDDTVTEGGRLCPQAFDAMHRLADAGVQLVAATGRPLGWARVIYQHWPLRAAIGENGAGWFWESEAGVQVTFFSSESERSQHARRLEELQEAVRTAMPAVRLSEDCDLRRCDIAFDIGERFQLAAHERTRLRELILDAGLDVTESSVHMHAIPGPWDKAKAIKRVLKEVLEEPFEANAAAWAYVGDSPNDAPAFGLVPLSVGVRNVLESSPGPDPMPQFITEHARGEGFAEFARRVLGAR